jgi:GTP cyclohydrolase I
METERIKAAVVELLRAIGEDPNRPALKNTPTKVAEAYTSFFRGIGVEPSSVIGDMFDAVNAEAVILKDIELVSICEHHLLPFTGVAHIAYLPNKKLAGLGRLASVIEVLAARPQLQENLTAEVADALESALDAKGVLVVIEARHQCVASRGARQPDVNTVTLASRGVYTEPSYRAEVLGLINKKP